MLDGHGSQLVVPVLERQTENPPKKATGQISRSKRQQTVRCKDQVCGIHESKAVLELQTGSENLVQIQSFDFPA